VFEDIGEDDHVVAGSDLELLVPVGIVEVEAVRARCVPRCEPKGLSVAVDHRDLAAAQRQAGLRRRQAHFRCRLPAGCRRPG